MRPRHRFSPPSIPAPVALYVGLAVVQLHVLGGRSWASLVAIPLVCIPIVLGVSRMYRGMHYLTDVIAGAVAGGLWIVIVVGVLLLGRATRKG